MATSTVDCPFTSSSEAPEPSSRYYSLFRPGDRVVVQSAVKGEAFYGTARWTGPIRKAHLGDAIPVVGVEIDKMIKLDKHFPDLHLDLTGKDGQTLFKVPFHHTRVFLPEQLVVHAEDFAVQQQKDIITQYEVQQAAKEFDLTAEEYQYQQVIMDNCKSDSKMTKGTSFESRDSGYSLTSDKLRSLSITSPLSPSDCQQLSVGSMVCIEDSNTVLYGVIQWIGPLPGCTDDLMAGIELDEPLEGCSDGTWEGKRLFDCSSGHGYFTSLESVKPDIRYLLEEEEEKRETSKNYSIGGRQYDSHKDNIGVTSGSFGYHSGVFQEGRRSFEETRTGYQGKDSYREECREGVDYYSGSHRNAASVSINSHKSMRYGASMMTGGGGREQAEEGSLEMTALIPSVVQSKVKELQQQDQYYQQPLSWRRDERRDERGEQREFEQLQRKVEVMEETHQNVTASLRKKERDYINLYESHEKLMEDYEVRERQYFQLKQLHESLLSKHEDTHYDYQQLKQLHQELVHKYQESSREESLERKEFVSVQASHQELEVKVQILESKLESKSRQLSSLNRQLTAIRNSWKISHNDISLTNTELGRGGWGVVWIGEFRGQRVAVKQMHEVIQGTDYMKLLHREIDTMSQLRHPNLLQFIGAVLDHPSGNPMIITEVMDTSLRSAYERKELTTDPDCRPVILSIMRDVAVGLNYLHCLPDPIIHRDVSSANVLLESKGDKKWKTKISDFGSANLAQAAFTKAPGALVYGAPECLQSVVDSKRLQTTKVDVFSYGITLCEILTCRFPEHQYFHDMLRTIKGFSTNLSSLIELCTQKSSHERPDMKQVIGKIDGAISPL